jgi:8-oxo-dGTP diphosphatase
MRTLVVGVHALITHGDRFLLVRRSLADEHEPGLWEFPGGGLEEKEDLYSSLRREVLEECGIKIIIRNLKQIYWFISKENKLAVHPVFLCGIKDKPAICLSKEHTEYLWADKDGIQKMRLTRLTRQCIERMDHPPSIQLLT